MNSKTEFIYFSYITLTQGFECTETHAFKPSDSEENGQRNPLFSYGDIFRSTPVTLELFINCLIIKTCTFGWEMPTEISERAGGGDVPWGISSLCISARPLLQHWFNRSCWKARYKYTSIWQNDNTLSMNTLKYVCNI